MCNGTHEGIDNVLYMDITYSNMNQAIVQHNKNSIPISMVQKLWEILFLC